MSEQTDTAGCEFHAFHTSTGVGVKRIIARRQGGLHGFHGFHTYSGGCVRSARPPACARPLAPVSHLPFSWCEIREIRETAKKPQDGRGAKTSHRRTVGVKGVKLPAVSHLGGGGADE